MSFRIKRNSAGEANGKPPGEVLRRLPKRDGFWRSLRHSRRHSLPSALQRPDTPSAEPCVSLILLGKGSSAGGAPNQQRSTDVSTPTTPSHPQYQTSFNSPYERTERLADVSERISGPKKVDAEKDYEYKTQKAATIRMMYEQVAEECEKLRLEYERKPTDQLQARLEETNRMVRRLEQQLLQLTGIPAESQAKSPSSGLPPPGGTVGDGFYTLQEDSPSGLPPIAPGHNPAPWLPSGPKHRKAGSNPETYIDCDSDYTAAASLATVSRSNSDSQKAAVALQEGATAVSAEELEKLRTSSLPSNVYDAVGGESSPRDSPATSPTPREPWLPSDDGTTATPGGHDSMQHEALLSPRALFSSSPPRDARTAPLQAVSPHQVDVISMEEEEFSTDEEHLSYLSVATVVPQARVVKLDDHGPFSDLNVLKHKPAHLAVFLNYLITNNDPSPLLFYLVTEQYTQGSMKEMRKWAYEIHSTFLVNTAPLRVGLDETLVAHVDFVLHSKHDKEDQLKQVFQLPRHIAQSQISELLADYRNKRSLGLGSLYGDHELKDGTMDKQAEVRIVEQYLYPHFERFFESQDKSDKNKALASALSTLLRQLGINVPRNNNALDRCQSFVTRDKKMFKLGKSTKKMSSFKGHQFVPQHYYGTTQCHHCQGVLWGVGNQGYQCTNCELNAHKACCELVVETCSRKKKEKRSSMLGGMIQQMRKTTNPNPAAIREAQRIHEEGYGSPTHVSTASFQIRPSARDEEDDDLEQLRTGNKVNRLVEQYSDFNKSTDEARSPLTPPGGGSPETVEAEEQKKAATNLSRSESLNKKRESRKSVRRTRSDVHVDDHTLKQLDHSGSSSNSSLSNRSLDSPSASHEVLNDVSGHQGAVLVAEVDSDLEGEGNMPTLEETIPKEYLKKLKPKEKKRQDVINELFYTEQNHMRNLKVMLWCFYRPMLEEPGISKDLINVLFQNLQPLIELHASLNKSFKQKKQEHPVVKDVADLLLVRFDGEEGEKFQDVCAKFCGRQSFALELLRVKQRKDQNLRNFLQEAASNPRCRKLELKDYIPMAMQRLTKYPLLIEQLLKYTSANSEEHRKLLKVKECSKTILSHVNQAVKDCENQQKLTNFQRRLDRRPFDNSEHPLSKEYKSFDLTRHTMIYDGALTWRLSKTKQIDLHVVLFEDILVLMQKVDDKLVLRCQSTVLVAGKEDTKFFHSPIIKLTELLTKNVATDRRAFFLVSTSVVGPQIYELVAFTAEEKEKWFRYITDTAKTHEKDKDSQHAQHPARDQHSRQNAKPPVAPPVPPHGASTSHGREVAPPSAAEEKPSERKVNKDEPEATSVTSGGFDRNQSASVESIEHVGKVEVLQVDQSQLIQPDEVVVADAVSISEMSESDLTPLERLDKRSAVIDKALAEKKKIVAEILQVPLQDYDNIAEIAGEAPGEKDVAELVLSSIKMGDELTQLVSDGLRPTDEPKPAASLSEPATPTQTTTGDAVAAAESSEPEVKEDTDSGAEGVSGKPTGAASSETAGVSQVSREVQVTLSAQHLLRITARLNYQLTQLLGIMTKREEEHENFRAELRAAQQQITVLQDLSSSTSQLRSPSHSFSHPSRPDSFISVTSSTSEAGEGAEELAVAPSGADESAAYSSSSPKAIPSSAVTHVVEPLMERAQILPEPESAVDVTHHDGTLSSVSLQNETLEEEDEEEEEEEDDDEDDDEEEEVVGFVEPISVQGGEAQGWAAVEAQQNAGEADEEEENGGFHDAQAEVVVVVVDDTTGIQSQKSDATTENSDSMGSKVVGATF